ncbi:MAG: type II toxin-antitoxin system RelE/ParE family toxin [Phyllobacteriaceae bacterium]|jgi:toxin ParE1/3/4|nr:type II toxin-antitoxin system RelE/ParE family toxin [Phyllobacteriaceae bacterium]
MKHRLTPKADTDIAGILRSTRKMFGPQQVLAYAKIISDGIDMVASDPNRVNCRVQDDVGAGVKSFHLEHVSARKGSASHQLFFVLKPDEDGQEEVVILSVLHDRMTPRRRLARVLRDEEVELPTASDPRR